MGVCRREPFCDGCMCCMFVVGRRCAIPEFAGRMVRVGESGLQWLLGLGAFGFYLLSSLSDYLYNGRYYTGHSTLTSGRLISSTSHTGPVAGTLSSEWLTMDKCLPYCPIHACRQRMYTCLGYGSKTVWYGVSVFSGMPFNQCTCLVPVSDSFFLLIRTPTHSSFWTRHRTVLLPCCCFWTV